MKQKAIIGSVIAIAIIAVAIVGMVAVYNQNGGKAALMPSAFLTGQIGGDCEWQGIYAWQDALGNQHLLEDDATWSVDCLPGQTWGEPLNGTWTKTIAPTASLSYIFTVSPDTPATGAAGAAVRVSIDCAHQVTIRIAVPTGIEWEVYEDFVFKRLDGDGNGWVEATILDSTGDAGLFNHSLAVIAGDVISQGNGGSGGGMDMSGDEGNGTINWVDPWQASSQTSTWLHNYLWLLIGAAVAAFFGAFTAIGTIGRIGDYQSGWWWMWFMGSTLIACALTIGAKMWLDADWTLNALLNLQEPAAIAIRILSAALYAFLLFSIPYIVYVIYKSQKK